MLCKRVDKWTYKNLSDLFSKMSIEQSPISNRQIAKVPAEYQSELKVLLKTTKEEKVTKLYNKQNKEL